MLMNDTRLAIDLPKERAEELKKLAKENGWCLCYEKNKSDEYTNLDVIVSNLLDLKNEHEENKEEIEAGEYGPWWEDEYGSDCTWQIGCHPVFSDSRPCLNEERGVSYPSGNTWEDVRQWKANCSECKALWLLEKYE